MKRYIIFTYILISTSLSVFGQDSQDSIAYRVQHLQEIVVKAPHLAIEDDHICAYPSAQQRKHARSGYDVLNSLMIPGLMVDCQKREVTSPFGAVTHGKELACEKECVIIYTFGLLVRNKIAVCSFLC